jgi:hypothetical protein
VTPTALKSFTTGRALSTLFQVLESVLDTCTCLNEILNLAKKTSIVRLNVPVPNEEPVVGGL